MWGSEVRCEEVGMKEALQELVRAGVMQDEAALGLSNFLRCIGMCVCVCVCVCVYMYMYIYIYTQSAWHMNSFVLN